MEDIFDYIDKKAEEYVERLINLCRVETIASRRVGIDAGANVLSDLIREVGGEPEIIPHNNTKYVVTKLTGNSNSSIGFYNHFDTHPAEPLESWDSPPFEPTIRKDILYARGASDNKGNVVARLCAIDAYKNVRGYLPINVIFFHDGEEEIGSPNLSSFLDIYGHLVSDAHGWIWEGGFKNSSEQLEVYLGFNGLLYAEFEVVSCGEDTHGSHAGMVPNAAWRLISALSTLKNDEEKILIDDYYASVSLPTHAEISLLRSLPLNLDIIKEIYQIKKLAGGSSLEEALERQYLYPYINISGINAGYQGEGVGVILPYSAKAKVEFYLVPEQDPDCVVSQLRSHLDVRGFDDVLISPLVKMPPSRVSPSSEFVKLIINQVEKIYGTAQVYPIMPGASPMGHFTSRFKVPGLSTGVGYANSRIHQPNENVRIADFIQGIKLIASILNRVGDQDLTKNLLS
jgi:acetylornithine deacetylase/succinyl-diaminopimelate desuccinylase-like protein